MRYYRIEVTDPKSGQVVTPPGFSGLLDGATYTSFVNGQTLPGAWNVELDLPVGPFSTPMGGGWVRIWGISIAEIGQASDLNFKNIAIYGGMQKGLPLANPAQAGLLVQGYVFQAFGNWIGNDMTLDMVIQAGTAPNGPGSISKPVNLVLNWKKGQQLGDAVKSALTTAFPGFSVDVNISSKLVRQNDEPGYFHSLTDLNQYLKSMSQSLINDHNYAGVDIVLSQKKFSVYDGTATSSQQPVQISYVDLIGQPTWIESPMIQLKCVMRSDIKVGNQIKLPATVVTNTAAANSSLVNQRVAFQGNFLVQQVRHLGNYRQQDAASWVTVINASPMNVQSAAGS